MCSVPLFFSQRLWESLQKYVNTKLNIPKSLGEAEWMDNIEDMHKIGV